MKTYEIKIEVTDNETQHSIREYLTIRSSLQAQDIANTIKYTTLDSNEKEVKNA